LISDDEQSSAPYLDAVVSYAFRGTARYHVPGHEGGPGADPGVRKAIGTDALAADVPLLIHGIDVGRNHGRTNAPSDWRPKPTEPRRLGS
jgi:arginine/lysine/ornithine decarboxylase